MQRKNSNPLTDRILLAPQLVIGIPPADFAAAHKAREAGLEMLAIPENYHDDLEARFALDPAMLDEMRALGILYDEDETGRYFQIYTRAFKDRFFFEIVQREGYDGFGAANAPIRLAAQARVARPPTIPRS